MPFPLALQRSPVFERLGREDGPRAKPVPDAVPWSSGRESRAESAGFTFEVIDDVAELDAIEADWSALYLRAALPHQVFLSFHWLRTWAHHYLGGGAFDAERLVFVTARRDCRLVMVLPLAEYRHGGIRRLACAGVPVSQYGDALVDTGIDAGDLVAAACRHAVRETGADMLDFRKVRADGHLAAAMARLGSVRTNASEAPFIDLQGLTSVDEYLARFSRNARKQRLKRRRQLEERGFVRFETLAPGRDASLAARAAIVRKRDSLAADGHVATSVSDPRFEAFFADVAGATGSGVECAVSVMTLEGEAIAHEIGLAGPGAYVAHVGVYDPAYRRYAPGILQIDETVGTMIARGVDRFDLLAPNDPYKAQFASGSVAVCDHAVATSLKGSVAVHVVLRLVLPFLRSAKDALPKLRARLRVAG